MSGLGSHLSELPGHAQLITLLQMVNLLDFSFYTISEIAQRVAILCGQTSRLIVDDAKSANAKSIDRGQWSACVETDMRRTRYQGVASKTWIKACIGNLENGVIENGVPAKGNVPSGLTGIQSLTRLEPLAIGVDQRHQGDGDAEHVSGQSGQSIEPIFGRCIQNRLRAQRPQALWFIVGHGRGLHNHVSGQLVEPRWTPCRTVSKK